jgi:hypothetical protein
MGKHSGAAPMNVSVKSASKTERNKRKAGEALGEVMKEAERLGSKEGGKKGKKVKSGKS